MNGFGDSQSPRWPCSPAARLARSWGFLLVLLALPGGCGGPDPAPRSALLISLDTTRSDVLGPYGGPVGLTPTIDRLAEEGVVFERAYSVAPITLPSHASMLTGLWPPAHGVRENGRNPLSPAAVTVAEQARQRGMQTAAFVAAVVLDASLGLDQGFETYQGPGHKRRSTDSHMAELPGDLVVDRALEWLVGRDRQRPYFLWVHLFDPHGPYDPPSAYRPEGDADARALYAGEVSFADAQVGRLLEALRADGSLEQTFVVLVGDHGEAFGEHRESTHGVYVWDTTLQVPLILRFPGGDRAGEREDLLARVADVAPTLLEAMNLPLTSTMDGKSLHRRWSPAAAASRGVYFESYSGYLTYGWSPLAGWRDAQGKYVHSSRPQFFDTVADPQEERDLLAGTAEDAVRERLQPYREALAEVGARRPLESEDALDETASLQADIESLGYVGAQDSGGELPPPLGTSTRPAPQHCVRIHQGGLRAQELINHDRIEEAVAILERLWQQQPDNPFLLDRLGGALVRLQRGAAAIPLLERLVGSGSSWPGSSCNLGLAYYQVGRVDDAVVQLENAVQRNPHTPFFWDTLLQVLADSGRTEAHAEWAARREEYEEAEGEEG